MRLVNIEPCEKLGHAMILYATDGGMLIQIRSCDLPTIDAVPVVRCKDCKHFRSNLENDTYCGCVGGLTDPEEHDFCSYGERKDGGSNG